MVQIYKDNGKKWKNDPSKFKSDIEETYKNATEEEIASATGLSKIEVDLLTKVITSMYCRENSN